MRHTSNLEERFSFQDTLVIQEIGLTKKASGGIATSIIDKDSAKCVRVEEGSEDNEFIITRHSQFLIPINVINVYGQQEARMSTEKNPVHVYVICYFNSF